MGVGVEGVRKTERERKKEREQPCTERLLCVTYIPFLLFAFARDRENERERRQERENERERERERQHPCAE